jgi:ubiquinone biosynthesis protein
MRLWRIVGISRVLLKHGFGNVAELILVKRPRRRKQGEKYLKVGFPSPRRIRLVLEELGPSFVKLGQLMSVRADLFPPDYIEEFKKLQDQVPAVPFNQIRGVVEDEIGRPISEVFPEFNPEPIAAASVAQVHLARLPAGMSVAVKVIRPGILKMIKEDIRLMYLLAFRLERALEAARIIGFVNLVEEFENTIFKELDMYIEAGSIEKFARNFPSGELYIPRVYWDVTTRSVLVMEHIEGIKMDQVDAIRACGIDPKEIALIGLRSFSRQLMEFGFFHADPHPGNTIVMYDGRVALVDFGITGYLEEKTMRQVANIFLGYAEHDYEMVMEALEEAGLINDTMDLQAFELDLIDMSERFYGRSLRNISAKDVYDQVMRLVLKYRIRMPRNLLLLLKTFIQTEALGKILGSDASILEVTKPYARDLIQRGYTAERIFRNFEKDTRRMSIRMREMPKFVHEILRQTAGGKQRLELSHSGFQEVNKHLEKGVNRLTVGLVISASVVAAALVMNASQEVFSFSIFGFRVISLTAFLGLLGYVIASVLGIWLIISIYRSGKL